GWRGIWIIIGIGALIVFVLRFSLPESPRWLATHGHGQRALDLLQRMGLRTVPLSSLRADAASDTKRDPMAIVFRHYPGRVVAGMLCFAAFFGIALGLGAWLPNILVERGFPIAKSLNSIFWMTLAFPCASAFMMYSLERFGRKPTAVVAFILAGVFGLIWANATTEAMVLAVGFAMIFCIQLAGNSSQVFIAEVFPTNARASGFGLAQAAGRIAAFFAIPAFLWIQQGLGLNAVFIAMAVIVAIAAVAVTQVGPEAKGLALDEVAPPTA
ncbi:MAG: MFS transporter, partial [Alphaproteobacteria bacterium]|nr:MFS transporter [Alphaproteobacteria bacterium]